MLRFAEFAEDLYTGRRGLQQTPGPLTSTAYNFAMRRFLICFLLCWLTFQSAWATVHDAAHPLSPSHSTIATAHDEAPKVEAGTVPDDCAQACEQCATHCAHSHFAALMCDAPGQTAAAMRLLKTRTGFEKPQAGLIRDIERPKWLSAAHSLAALLAA